MTTPAQELAHAATTLRTLATEATHEDRTRWMVGHTLGSKSPVVVDDHNHPTVLLETWAAHREKVDAYLAAFASPAVALAVAKWLETSAVGPVVAVHSNMCPDPDCDINAALAVARQINATVPEEATP